MPYKKGSHSKKNVPTPRFRKMVKKVVQSQAETKWVEGAAASLSFDTTPASATVVKCLDADISGNIVQGLQAKHRIGDRIHLKSLDFRAVFVPTAATVGAVRVIIGQVLDQQTASALSLTYGMVLSGLSGGNDMSCITSHYEHEPLTSYKILTDEVITWDASNAAAPRVLSWHFNQLALRNRNYDDAASQYTGAFFYMLVSADAVAATLKYPRAKISYTDI